jgi:hypothetical protein
MLVPVGFGGADRITLLVELFFERTVHFANTPSCRYLVFSRLSYWYCGCWCHWHDHRPNSLFHTNAFGVGELNR